MKTVGSVAVVEALLMAGELRRFSAGCECVVGELEGVLELCVLLFSSGFGVLSSFLEAEFLEPLAHTCPVNAVWSHLCPISVSLTAIDTESLLTWNEACFAASGDFSGGGVCLI